MEEEGQMEVQYNEGYVILMVLTVWERQKNLEPTVLQVSRYRITKI